MFERVRAPLFEIVAGARKVFENVHPLIGRARRIGVTGPPGAGKSTLTTCLARAYRDVRFYAISPDVSSVSRQLAKKIAARGIDVVTFNFLYAERLTPASFTSQIASGLRFSSLG